MIQRLVNCDFFTKSQITTKLSNKAKLVYFYFFINADDYGFVGNGKEIAESLDRCEENFENTLFQYTYGESINELVQKRLVIEFIDKVDNHIYLIRHWFLHNRQLKFYTTNYMSFLEQVEIVDNKYQLKPIKERNIRNELKEMNGIEKKSNSLIHNDFDNSSNVVNSISTNNKGSKPNKKSMEWDDILDDLDNYKKGD